MTLKNLYNTFVSHPESMWIIRAFNASLLYQFVKDHNIKKVLDLGTGIGAGAAIIALALKEKGEIDWHIDTVENLDKCIKIAKELIPEELKINITQHKSEVVIWQTDKIPCQFFSIFETVPEGEYDLIINDGPAPIFKDGHFIDLPNATITKMLMEDKIKTGAFIMWDGRIHMLKMLERYFGDNFYLAKTAKADLSLGGGKNYFNVLERKDNPITFRDALLDEMKDSTYFKNIDEKTINTDNSPATSSSATTSNTGT